MAVSMEDIKKLRAMTGAGLGDVKKALEEAEGNMDRAKEILRERGQAIAAKREARETSNGCVLVKANDKFGAIIALKCETDFVAMNADFVGLTQKIINAAVEAQAKTLDEVKALTIDGMTIEDAVKERSGVTGEKMELDGYNILEGANIYTYDHMNRHGLCVLVQMNKAAEEQGHNLTMQVAAMNPVALDQASVPQSVKDSEMKIAIEKTKEEQCEKAVAAALKKAGINPAHVDSEDHMASNMEKGWITQEQVDQAREIKKTVSEEKLKNLPEQMIQNIANGRLNKFFKESCLMEQEYIQEAKMSVKDYLQATDKELAVVAFKRFTLRAE
ncbi:MAG: translation elongation factor Ts [Prevotellaceae bacterium]|nr:translation elongation factor Ts [Prevotellaceae bacterium]